MCVQALPFKVASNILALCRGSAKKDASTTLHCVPLSNQMHCTQPCIGRLLNKETAYSVVTGWKVSQPTFLHLTEEQN